MRLFVTRAVVLGLSMVVAAAVVGQPLADRLPATTKVYAGWSPNASMQETRAARMLADERIVGPWQRLLASEVGSATKGGDLANSASGVIAQNLPQLLRDAGQCEGCFALLDLAKGTHDSYAPQAVLVLNLGARRKSFEQHFKPIHELLKDRLGERIRMLKLADSWLWIKTTKDRPEYTWGFVGDRFVIYFGPNPETFLPTLVAPAADGGLMGSRPFAEALAKLPGEAVLTTYVDVKSAADLLRASIAAGHNADLIALSNVWPKLLSELGLDNVWALAEKTTIEQEQFVTRSLLRTDGPPHGLLTTLLGGGGVDDTTLKCIPADAMLAVAFRLDLARFYEQFKASSIAIMGEDARKAFGDFEDFAAGRELPIAKVLEPLGDQWSVYVAPSTGGFVLTGLTLVGQVRDPDRFSRTIGAVRIALTAAFGKDERVRLADYEVDGVRVYYLDASAGFMPFAPAWAVTGDRFVVALYPQVVEDAVRQINGGEGKSLLDNPQFAATRRRLGGSEVGPLYYMSGPELVRGVYPILLPVITVIRAFGGIAGDGPTAGVGLAELLPSMQRLLAYVGSDGATVRLTPDGILRTKTVANPLLSPLTIPDSFPLWIALAVPGMADAGVAADRTRSAANLRQLGLAIHLYANNNQGKLPPDLETAVKAMQVSKEILVSPFAEGKPGPHYKYVAHGNLKDLNGAATAILAYDAAELADGDGASVLFGDGHVDWFDRAAFGAAMKQSDAAQQVPKQ